MENGFVSLVGSRGVNRSLLLLALYFFNVVALVVGALSKTINGLSVGFILVCA